MRSRMRVLSSPAALRVNVRPRISLGLTTSLASSHSTRLAIVSVLPLPAPATTSEGLSGASMTARCCCVGRGLCSASAMSNALITGDGPHPVRPQARGVADVEHRQLSPPRELRGRDEQGCLAHPLPEPLEL